MQKLLLFLSAPKITLGATGMHWNAHGQLLLVHHTYRTPAWGFPSGLVSPKEQPDAALARELREELGVDVTVGALLHAEIDVPTRHLTLYYQIVVEGTPVCDGAEVDRYRYAGLDEFAALVGAPMPAWLARAGATIPDQPPSR